MHFVHLRRARLLPLLVLAALLAAALVAPSRTEAGGGCRGGDRTVSSSTTVEMVGGCFQATVTEVTPGTEVTWVNRDQTDHAVTGATVAWGDYDMVGEGESVTHTFDAPGVYPYYCIVHPGMVGAVVVAASEEPVTPPADASEGEGDAPVTAAVAVGALMLGVVGATVAPRWWRRAE